MLEGGSLKEKGGLGERSLNPIAETGEGLADSSDPWKSTGPDGFGTGIDGPSHCRTSWNYAPGLRTKDLN